MKVDWKQLLKYSRPILRQKKLKGNFLKQNTEKQLPQLRYFVLIVLSLAIFLTGCGTTLKQVNVSDEAVKIEREKQEDIAFSRFMDKQNRLYSISYPMLVASAELFTDKVRPTYGFMLHDNDLYGKVLGKEY